MIENARKEENKSLPFVIFCSGDLMRRCFGAGPAKQSQQCLHTLAQSIEKNPSILEMSHRSDEFSVILEKTKTTLRELLDVPDDMEILFLSGGASFQFLMSAANLLKFRAGYVITGLFSKLAYEAARQIGECVCCFDGINHPYDLSDFPKRVEGNYDYIHVCLNNSIYGTRTCDFECDCPVIADASSILGIEPVNFHKYDLVYASAQKNFGISGMCLVFIRKNLKFNELLSPLISYRKQIEANSMVNTPPVLAIVMCGLCAEELLKRKKTLYEENRKKAEMLYEYLDQSTCFETLVKKNRSLMNVCFKMKDEAQEKNLIQKLKQAGFDGIQGHRLTGHLRVSLNVFVTIKDVECLIHQLKEYEKTRNV